METLADKVHAAWRANEQATGELFDALQDIFGPNFDNSETDDYDNSVELIDASEELSNITIEQQRAVMALGFSRFWIRFRDNTEQYFWEDKREQRKARGR